MKQNYEQTSQNQQYELAQNEQEEEKVDNKLDIQSQNNLLSMKNTKDQKHQMIYTLLQSPIRPPTYHDQNNQIQQFDLNYPTQSAFKLNQDLQASFIDNQEEMKIEHFRFVVSKNEKGEDINQDDEQDDLQSKQGLFHYNNILEDLELLENKNDPNYKKLMIKGLDFVNFQLYFEYIDLNNINTEKLQKKYNLKDIHYLYLLQIKYSNIKWKIRRTLEQIMELEKQYVLFMNKMGFENFNRGYLTLEEILDQDARENNPNKVLKYIEESLKMIINQFQFEQVGIDPLIENKNLNEISNKQSTLISEFKNYLRAFLEFSDIFEEGKQKYKEVYVYKKAGGRYKQSLCQKLNCKNLFGCYDKRYFLISQEGVMYTKGLIHPDSTLSEVILFDYHFQVEYGKKQTGQEFGIHFITHSRTLCIQALNVFDYLDILYAIKEAYDNSIYGGVHRFNSFAPPRQKCFAKWYIDGQNYFQDVFDAIESAQQEIFITDWWLSPELYLKRPAQKFPESRIDQLFQRKANEGVQIFIIVYQEPEMALNIESKYTQSKLQSLHPTNINVVRHPKFLIPFMWSHHEKIVVVDQEVGFLGGLDLCYGRWDTQQHPMVDEQQQFPGIDYCNSRIKDFQNVQDFEQSDLDRQTQHRMPWHDVALRIIGLPVKDLAKHFIQYWNFSQIDIGNKGGHRGCLIPQEREGQKNMFKPYIKEFNQKLKGIKNKFEGYIKEKITKIKPEIQNYLNDHNISFEFINNLDDFQKKTNQSQEKNMKTSFEIMLLNEDKKPRDEIIQLLQQLKQIKDDNLYDEFEDQSNYSLKSVPSLFEQQNDSQKSNNSFVEREKNRRQSALSSVNVSKIETATRFSFYKSMFDRTIDGNLSKIKNQIQNTKSRLKLQAKKYKQLEKDLNTQQCQILRSASNWSLGLSKKDTEASIQIAYLTLINESKHFIYIENQFFMSSHAGAPLRNQISVALVQRIKKAAQNQENFLVVVILPLLPGFEGEIDSPNSNVMKIQLHWEYQTICRGGTSILEDLATDPNIPDPSKYIKFFGLRTHSVINNKPVTEMVYVHSKMMIIDDQIAIIGSANINDRSLKGNRDSEIAAIVEDNDQVTSKMDGEPYMASKFAHTLRCELYKEHFQIENTIDPLNPQLIAQIDSQALQNTLLYREIFRCYPDDELKESSQLEEFKSKAMINYYPLKAHYFKGNVVQWPKRFLENENMKFSLNMKEYYCPDINFT
ncbi:hypothetical protein ABPG74_008152 [Tetrahymena malaccensis]